MKDYEFNHDTLFEFSNSIPYNGIPSHISGLFNSLKKLEVQFNFPAVNNDIGSFIQFMGSCWAPKIVFEMGSGYGQSAFWFLLGCGDTLEKIYLTERRTDLEKEFNALPWPQDWREKIEYHQDDAFNVLKDLDKLDLALIDGVKSDYLKCLKSFESKMKPGAIVLIDNSYWRGSFLDEEVSQAKASARNIRLLHEYIRDTNLWSACFIPYKDGLTVLKKN